KIAFHYVNDKGDSIQRRHAFEGVIPNLERRYHDTESTSVHEELSKFVTTSGCPDCDGSRLNEAARHVFVDGSTLPDVVKMPVGKALVHFNALKLTGKKGEIADKILKE